MRVTLFGSIWSPEQRSMATYPAQLAAALRSFGRDDLWVREVSPGAGLAGRLANRCLGRRLGHYFRQYVEYQLTAPLEQADVNHVTDHSYGHLVHTLDMRRTVVTVHDLVRLRNDLVPPIAGRASRPARGTARFSLAGVEKAARVIADSEATRRDLARLSEADPSKIVVIPLGVSDLFRPIDDREALVRVRERHGLPSGRLILHVGHCGFYKNIEGLLEILALLVQQKGIDATLVKVGTGFQPHQLHLIGRLGLSERVQDLGQVTDDELVGLYNVADVLAHPSLHEGFGWPPLEAMACGTPVVCSDAGALPEVVGDAAITVAPQAHGEFADALAAMLSRPALAAEYRERGRRRAARFSWANTAARTLEVYEVVHSSIASRR